MSQEIKSKTEQHNAQRLIFEMIEASIELSIKKGKHSLTKGCNCIACVNKRKELLRGKEPEWKYTL